MLKTELEREVTDFTGASTLGDGIRRYASMVCKEAGVASIPVNLRAIATHLGVRAIQVRDIACDGALMPLETDKGYTVALSSQTSWERQRFSLAHELGHIVLHRLIPETRSFETRTVFTPPGGKAEERFCNAFAAELLMPHSPFMTALTKIQMNVAGLIDLALTFQVSVTAAAYRIRGTELCRDFALVRLRPCADQKGVRADTVLVNFRRSPLRVRISHTFGNQSAPSKAFKEVNSANGWELLRQGNLSRRLYFSVAPSSLGAASSIALVTKGEHHDWCESVAPLGGPDEERM